MREDKYVCDECKKEIKYLRNTFRPFGQSKTIIDVRTYQWHGLSVTMTESKSYDRHLCSECMIKGLEIIINELKEK